MEKRKRASCPPCRPPFINWAWRPWYGILLLASLGWLPGCAPSQLLHTCSLAECGGLEESPWFHSNNWKHQCYQHSPHAESKTQQLLGGKLYPSRNQDTFYSAPSCCCYHWESGWREKNKEQSQKAHTPCSYQLGLSLGLLIDGRASSPANNTGEQTWQINPYGQGGHKGQCCPRHSGLRAVHLLHGRAAQEKPAKPREVCSSFLICPDRAALRDVSQAAEQAAQSCDARDILYSSTVQL